MRNGPPKPRGWLDELNFRNSQRKKATSMASPSDYKLMTEYFRKRINSNVFMSLDEAARVDGRERVPSGPPSSIAHLFHNIPKSVTWDSIIGNTDAKLALREALYPENPKIVEAYGRKLPRGVLLYGPPGTGKTMLAKAAAAGQTICIVNGSELQTKYVGETEELIRSIFSYARSYFKQHGKQLIIFIDEADSMLPSRQKSYRFEISAVSTFLSEMDGLKDNCLFFILATNRPTDIDDALLRPGRIDRTIKIERPTLEDAKKLFELYLEGVPRTDYIAPYVDVFAQHLSLPIFNEIAVVGQTARKVLITLEHKLSGAVIADVVEGMKNEAIRRDTKSGNIRGVILDDIKTVMHRLAKETLISQDDLIEAIARAPDQTISAPAGKVQ